MKFLRLALIIILIFLSGCTKEAGNQKPASKLSYDEYTQLVFDFYDEFKSNDFELITERNPMDRIITVLPDMQLDSRKTDAYKDNQEEPSRFEFYYFNEKEETGVKVNIIYNPDSKQEGVLYKNIISPHDNISIKKDKQEIRRPAIDEISFTSNGYLFVITSWSSKKNITNDEVTKFIQISKGFVKNVESYFISKVKKTLNQ